MRTLTLLPLAVVVCSFAAITSAQQVGDRIVTITDASLRSQDDTTGTVHKGNILVVKNVNGDWFWVIFSTGHETVKGWINRSEVIPFSQAFDFFHEELRRSPSASAYIIRGMIWAQKGENDIALGDFSEAIQLDPNNKWAYLNRSVALKAKKEYDNALSDINEAIQLDPKIALAYCCRGILWKAKGEYDKALSDYNEAIRLDPKDADPWNGRAWLAATCPDARFRDGKKAVEDATKACELSGWKNWNSFDNLAAAYAEAGDSSNAVKWEEKAIERAPEKSKGELRFRLDLYKAHKPYREEVTKSANGLGSAPVPPPRRGRQSPPE